MTEFLKKIITPQLDFEGVRDDEKFIKLFCDLYRIELFKDGLDLILTKVQQRHLRFEVKFVKGWDTNIGCFLTEQKSFFDKTLGVFSTKNSLKIILRSLNCNVLAHEMAHALEFESKIDLGEEFRRCIGYDMKNRSPNIITLKGEVQRLMVDALKSYKPQQFLSELFARYFELLSISRNVVARGDFTTSDVMVFFENTTNFINKIFNSRIHSQIDPSIAKATIEIVEQVKLVPVEQKFQQKIDSRQQKFLGSWTKGVKSNAMWQKGWQNNQQSHQEIEEKK